jgi:2',3'-cyclic-nucleotide 2'-phosphodiesterase
MVEASSSVVDPCRPVWPDPPADGCQRMVLIGDIVGKPGVGIVRLAAPWLRSRLRADWIVANAENAADGSGLTVRQYQQLRQAGVDVITLGDHAFRKREIFGLWPTETRLLRPANFPPSAPGAGIFIGSAQRSGLSPVAIISLQGRTFMRPVDCPFHAAQRLLQGLPPEVTVVLVELHGEATSEKQVLARLLDGQVGAVLGTHTHVTTADEQILPAGTALQCDVGMTGPFESILGRKVEPVLRHSVSFEPTSFHVATGDVRLSASWLDIDQATGRCCRIERLQWPLAEIEAWGENPV